MVRQAPRFGTRSWRDLLVENGSRSVSGIDEIRPLDRNRVAYRASIKRDPGAKRAAPREATERREQLAAVDTTHERRPRWAARDVTLGEPLGTWVSSHRDHDGLYECVLPFLCDHGRLVRGFCIVAESECSVFSPE